MTLKFSQQNKMAGRDDDRNLWPNHLCSLLLEFWVSLQWRHNERDGVLNHQPYDCLLSRLFKAQIKENIKAPRDWLLWGEFTGDRWIPRTKGQ